MRYEPAPKARTPPQANTGSHARDPPASPMRPVDLDEAMNREAAELDDWEDEGGSTAGQVPESPYRHPGRVFDELSG